MRVSPLVSIAPEGPELQPSQDFGQPDNTFECLSRLVQLGGVHRM